MNNELMTQIEALDDREYLHEWGTAKAMGDGIPVTAIKSLAAELTLANKKLAILQASNDHYAEHNWWLKGDDPSDPFKESQEEIIYIYGGNGYDFARKAQEQIARLEGENG